MIRPIVLQTRRLLLLAVVLVAADAYAQEDLRPERPVAFVGGMLLDGYEAPPIYHSVVVISNGKIAEVGNQSDTVIPDDAIVIDAGGKTVMPGLIDANVHMDLIGHGDYERLHDPVHRKDMPPDIYAEVMASFEDFHRLAYFRDIGHETRHSKTAARQFIDAGAYMGVGTDAASPLNFHTEAMWYEMSALVDSGMTPIEVISAATKTNAEILGKSHELGTIEDGKLADLIVVDGNPLADIDAMQHVDIVVKDGVIWYAEQVEPGAVTGVGHAF